MVATEFGRGIAVARLRMKRREVIERWAFHQINFERMGYLTHAIDIALLRLGILR